MFILYLRKTFLVIIIYDFKVLNIIIILNYIGSLGTDIYSLCTFLQSVSYVRFYFSKGKLIQHSNHPVVYLTIESFNLFVLNISMIPKYVTEVTLNR